MHTRSFSNDIPVLCVTATSFPDGVLAAHQTLHSAIPFSTHRRYFGISYAQHLGKIIYKAAAEQLTPEEPLLTGFEAFIIPRGYYLSIFIPQFRSNIAAIGEAFQQLLTDPRLDPNGFCIEQYEGDDDVYCMVKLISEP
ncbi:MAG: transcriptional regulator [Bacteroidetes bacterium]|nr:transcriptional regulator [Bacteroidota bacterium]